MHNKQFEVNANWSKQRTRHESLLGKYRVRYVWKPTRNQGILRQRQYVLHNYGKKWYIENE